MVRDLEEEVVAWRIIGVSPDADAPLADRDIVPPVRYGVTPPLVQVAFRPQGLRAGGKYLVSIGNLGSEFSSSRIVGSATYVQSP